MSAKSPIFHNNWYFTPFKSWEEPGVGLKRCTDTTSNNNYTQKTSTINGQWKLLKVVSFNFPHFTHFHHIFMVCAPWRSFQIVTTTLRFKTYAPSTGCFVTLQYHDHFTIKQLFICSLHSYKTCKNAQCVCVYSPHISEPFLYCDQCKPDLDAHMQKKASSIFLFLIHLVPYNLFCSSLKCETWGLKAWCNRYRRQKINLRHAQSPSDTLKYSVRSGRIWQNIYF